MTRWLAALAAIVIGASILVAGPEPVLAKPVAAKADPVPVAPVPVAPPEPDAAERAVSKTPVTVSWPAAAVHELTPGGRSGGVVALKASDAGQVRVEVADARELGLTGVLLRARRTDGERKRANATIEIDYSGFRAAAGGGFGARLQLRSMPDGAIIPSRNNVNQSRLTADIPVSHEDSTFAVVAAAEGSTGSFSATDLTLSARWQVGLQSGSFTWEYPLRVPEMPGQLKPDLAVNYNSGSVDGRMGSSNNQPSWVGEGFDLSTGYIQRSFRTCRDDTGGNAGNYDQCWVSDNAAAVFSGVGGELVRDDTTGTWRAQEDEGWRVELLTGANNGDNNGEYWRLTSPSGTQYYFGLNRLPGWTDGRATTGSTFTAPVFANHANEPCRTSTPATSWCQQAYRWNLDYVVDRHGDAMSYWYTQELNSYGRWNGNPYFGETTQYVRGGHLNRIDYGLREGSVFTAQPGARIVFAAADRCNTTGSACDPANQSNWKNWPDVPWDQRCTSSCTYYWAPTFWTTKRLASVTTQVYTGLNHSNVESWTLRHSYPDPYPASDPWTEPNDASRSLWLNGITHAAGTLTEPEVRFSGVSKVNRHNASSDFPGMYKWRVSAVDNEVGGRIEVSYSAPQCGGEPYIIPDRNESRCYPRGELPGRLDPDVFYKYVVTRVVERDQVGGAPAQTTDYEYVGPAAWHYDDSDATPTADRDWNQWRGYQKIRVRTGDPAQATQNLTEHIFLRGMTGDRNLDGTTKTVSVPDSQGGTIPDQPYWRGFTRETVAYNGTTGAWLEKTLAEPVQIRKTASRARTGLPALEAYLTNERVERATIALSGGGVRTTELRREFDSLGRLITINDLADTATADDDACTRKTYAENQTEWIIDAVSRVESVGVHCAATPTSADLFFEQRLYYDGATVWGAAPTKGDVTRIEQRTETGYADVARIVPDAHGRTVEHLDGLNNRTRTTFTPAVGGPLTGVATLNPLDHSSSTTVGREYGRPTRAVDGNGRVTEMEYDALGRLRKAWGPGRDRLSNLNTPSAEFVYGTNSVESKTLLASGGYLSKFTLFDGFLRARQVQAPSPAGGRIVADTLYDSFGRVDRVNNPYRAAGTPGTTIVSVADSAVPGQTKYLYDGVNRETAEIFRSLGVEKWRTSTSYTGNSIVEDAPEGATDSTRVFDGLDRLVELRQGADATRYTYNKRGDLATVTDALGNVWRYTYDLKGRRIRTEDPDTGTTTATYDNADRVKSTTDSRDRTLTHTYDAIGRKTATHEGATQLTGWTYDRHGGVGLPATSTRYSGGHAYTQEVLGYDNGGRPTGTAVVIPAAEGTLAGRYETTFTYNVAGQVETATLPALGSLPSETLRFGYDPGTGAPASLAGYVDSVAFTELAELKSMTTGQVTREFTYEAGTGRLSGATVKTPTTTVANLGYTYDPAGNVKKLHDTVTGDAQCFQTDHLQRLTEAWTPVSADCTAAPSANALGGPAPYWHSYTYDQIGNRRTEVQHTASGDTRRVYGYQTAHRLRDVTTNGSQVDSYAYDADGNTTARPGQTLTWDAEGRLANVNGTTSFVYDADGDRLIRRDPAGTTLYLDNAELRRTSTGGLEATRYYTFGTTTIAVRQGGRLSWLVPDHHGTAQLSVDATTLAVTRRYFLPFGAPRGTSGTWPGERGFVDGATDSSIGLTHLGAREYDPAIGRFVSVDPLTDVEDPQTLHGYAYALNNPMTFSDPDGLKAKPPKDPYKHCGGTKRACEYREEQLVKRLKEIEQARKKLQELAEKLRKQAEEARKRNRPVLADLFKKLADWVTELTKSEVWSAIKAAATICALVPGAGTATCGAVAATMSAVDGLVKLRQGDKAGAALEFASALTGGIGAVANKIGQAARATSKALRKGRDWANDFNVPGNPIKWLRRWWDPRLHPLKPIGKALEWMAKKSDSVARWADRVENQMNKLGSALGAGGYLHGKLQEEEKRYRDRVREQL